MPTEKESLLFRKDKWSPIPRLARTIPFGYREDENDPNILQPVELELDALELAKKHLKQFSYRDVAIWLSEVTGRHITHVGLWKRLKIERTRQQKVKAVKNWAKRLEEAQKKIQHYEQLSLGARRGEADDVGDPEV